ncbi:MAG: hypothetical protein K8953_10605 [Proteobacteria bacterium]|nr:hypothetical protein [Pseudomonadota bacterium]
MQEFIDLFGVLATGVIAFATVVLVYVTWNLARVSKRAPFVVGNLESSVAHPRYVNFVIRNTGNAPAFDIKAEISPPIPDVDGKPFEGQIGIDGKPLDSTVGSHYSILILPPNQMYSFMGFDTRKTSMEKFDITISWASKPNGKRQKPLTHSIDNRGNRGGWHDKGLDEIARELEKITQHFRKFNPKDPR